MKPRTVNRRQFGAGLIAGVGLIGLKSGRALAGTTLELGSMRLDTLSDGYLTQSGEGNHGPMPVDELNPILDRYGIDHEVINPVCNVTLVRDEDRVILFDAGSGTELTPTAGTLVDSMAELGIDPTDVTHVVISHAHADHIWGLLDDFDDPMFPDATIMMGQKEWDYWWDPETVNTIDESRVFMAVGARRRMVGIEENVVLFEDGQEILPGVMARGTFGHTPGHMSFELNAGNSSAMIISDAVPDHHVSFERPEWRTGRDQDMDLGAKSRVSLLDQLASAQMPLVGFHIPGGGVGYAERIDGGFRFVAP